VRTRSNLRWGIRAEACIGPIRSEALIPKIMMAHCNVVIGFSEALAAPEVAWSLVDAGFRVQVIARKGQQSALRQSRHVVCYEVFSPESDLRRARSDVERLLKSALCGDGCVPRLLFPLDDTALCLFNELELGRDWLLVGPQGDTAKIALNKQLQTEIARESGFNVPQTAVVNSTADALAFSAAMGFPIILKPVECVPIRDNRKVKCRKFICANASELQEAINQWGECVPLLAQTFVVGSGEGIFGIAGPDGIRAWSAHRRLRMMNPQGSGSSACMSQTVPADLMSKVAKLIEKVQWQGLFMIELLRDHCGDAWFVELNGRPWGSIALSRRQGFEYPAWSALLAIDPKAPVGMAASVSPGLVCRHLGRELMHLLFVMRGPRSKALSDWPNIWESFAAVLRLRRGERYYNWRSDDPFVFFADCFYTLRQNIFKNTGH
jgi:hypothetical protein